MKVFWSWQSDTHGKTGRHFVKAALEGAVHRLNTPENIDEPLEREVELDHDRKNVSGSPDLAATIFAKIANSDVVVADVTPVVTVARTPTKEDKRTEKGIMNPNVAIELGYALSTLASEDVLMVLNLHYGDRNSLPFDLAHKGGPVTYDLAPDADNSTVKEERKKLEQRFYECLKPYLTKPAPVRERTEFHAQEATYTEAIFFAKGEVMAKNAEDVDLLAWYGANGNGLYLRLIPVYAQTHGYSTAEVLEKVRRFDLKALGLRTVPPVTSANKFGPIAVTVRPGESLITGFTQVFKTGEVWGYTPWFLRHQDKFIPILAQEAALNFALNRYVRFMQEALDIPPPYRVIAGLVGAEGYVLRHDDFPDTSFGPIEDTEREIEVPLPSGDAATMQGALKLIFQDLWRLAGRTRPDVFPYPWTQGHVQT